MSRNIEIKARATNPAQLAAIAQALCEYPPQSLKQTDTFFEVPKGRLKLRVTPGHTAELIYYRRNDKRGPKGSTYNRIPLWFPKLAYSALSLLLPKRGQVIKDRYVYFVGQTRIHLDYVYSLGTFVELEVVLGHRQTDEEGVRTANQLMNDLQILESDLVEVSYIDLMTLPRDTITMQ